ncbi:hypothetical protein TNCV_362021 [Trichonephila clavipes]|nr:hypothetical protein TNCV_362021 [Trichonephila clavipes]
MVQNYVVRHRVAEQCDVNIHSLTLHEKVVSCLREKAAVSTATFIQDGATSHTANTVKEFLIQTFEEENHLQTLQVSMASSVYRSHTSRLLAVGIAVVDTWNIYCKNK